mmetsp:Transcript_16809/g.26474  ORF Transcript_16809/g.26474 Transcript_16809/m.26474 type:complete len:349 (-) Transcript_16809:364-1410(-)
MKRLSMSSLLASCFLAGQSLSFRICTNKLTKGAIAINSNLVADFCQDKKHWLFSGGTSALNRKRSKLPLSFRLYFTSTTQDQNLPPDNKGITYTSVAKGNSPFQEEEEDEEDDDDDDEEVLEDEEYNADDLIEVYDEDELGNLNREKGSVTIDNTQRKVPIDTDILQQDLQDIMDIVGYRHYDVNMWITTEKKIRELNREYRGIDKGTDILSFPFHETRRPEILPPPRHELEMNLGEMIVSPLIVQRVMRQDLRMWQKKKSNHRAAGEGGVSGAMARTFDIQERLAQLALHGILHLLGHDHEDDRDHARMVAREEQVLAELARRRWARRCLGGPESSGSPEEEHENKD